MSKPGFFSRLGRGITVLRTFIVNTAFVLVMVVVLAALFGGEERISVPENSALLLDPAGELVEQVKLPDSWEELLFIDGAVGQTAVADVERAISLAASDTNIRMLVLNLDDLFAASHAQAQRVGAALTSFKESGKSVIAYGTSFSQLQYHIASHADKVYMHPMGQLLLTGLGGSRLFFKDALDKLDVQVHVFRVGDYKSATEPYTRSNMSDEARQDSQRLVDGIWSQVTADIALNRGLSEAQLSQFSNFFPDALEAVGGDMAQAAMQANLVDGLMTMDEIRDEVAAQVGWQDDALNSIDYRSYLLVNSGSDKVSQDDAQVAVVKLIGPIFDYAAEDTGIASAEQISALIDDARKDARIHALVLRVDSPGGTPYGSELIRDALAGFQATGRPVVASFASTAASGGYWVAATADAIVAEPMTVTGSIGIFGLVPSFENTLSRLGIFSDGVGSTLLARGLDPISGVSPDVKRILQLNVEHGYRQFTQLVATGRDIPSDQLELIAHGRVWLGIEAKELGLVDELGSLEQATSTAARLAQLDSWEVIDLRRPLDPKQLMMMELIENFGLASMVDDPRTVSWINRARTAVSRLAMMGADSANASVPTYALCLACPMF